MFSFLKGVSFAKVCCVSLQLLKAEMFGKNWTDHMVSRPCIDKITFTASSSSNDTYVRLVSNMSGES